MTAQIALKVIELFLEKHTAPGDAWGAFHVIRAELETCEQIAKDNAELVKTNNKLVIDNAALSAAVLLKSVPK